MKKCKNKIIMEYIRGEYFVNLADNVKIYYRDTHEVNELFRNPPKDDFILVSNNSDGKITDKPKEFDADVNLMPNNLIKWYGQNVNYKHDKIESLPIGLENSKWFRQIDKLSKIKNKLLIEKKNVNLLYLNHNVRTNIEERLKPYKLFNGKNWTTCENGANGFQFNNYIDKIYNHKFVLCPEGNGIDTHRTWETLYLNSIPIEKRNINNQFFKDLPICFVDDWEEITEDFLNKEYERIINTKWNLDKLDFNYWKNKILSNVK
jgi:hypothetical protein